MVKKAHAVGLIVKIRKFLDRKDEDYRSEKCKELQKNGQQPQDNHSKDNCVSHNQSMMQTSSQIGGIVIAILAIMLSFNVVLPGSYPVLYRLESNVILFILGTSAISFFTATTFYLRGSNPEIDCIDVDYLNEKGDVFFATGLIGLFIVPILLFHVLNLMLAMELTTISVGIIFLHLFQNKNRTGLVVMRIFILGIANADTLANTRSRKALSSMSSWLIIFLFYSVIVFFLVEGVYKTVTHVSLVRVFMSFIGF